MPLRRPSLSHSRRPAPKKIKHLVKLKSIGPEFATVLVGEVFYRTFNYRKQIGSYVGLTPSHFQSGSTSHDQGISKAGNAKARTTMIELAWLWLRNQPDSRLSVCTAKRGLCGVERYAERRAVNAGLSSFFDRGTRIIPRRGAARLTVCVTAPQL